MTSSYEVEAEIRRLAHAEGWPRGTIANQLGVHHEVVERVLDAETVVEGATASAEQARSVQALPPAQARRVPDPPGDAPPHDDQEARLSG